MDICILLVQLIYSQWCSQEKMHKGTKCNSWCCNSSNGCYWLWWRHDWDWTQVLYISAAFESSAAVAVLYVGHSSFPYPDGSPPHGSFSSWPAFNIALTSFCPTVGEYRLNLRLECAWPEITIFCSRFLVSKACAFYIHMQLILF